MSDAAQGTGGARADAGAQGGGQLGVLLVCFDTLQAAAKARHSLDQKLRSGGAALLDTDPALQPVEGGALLEAA
jgi:hypothetical protein